MKKLLKTTVFALFVGCSTFLFAQNNPKDLVPAEFYDELIKTGKVEKIHVDEDKIDLLPSTKYDSIFNQNRVAKEQKKFGFIYESLFYLNKADLIKSSGSKAETLTIDDVSRVFRSVSKMEGMKYFSSTRKKEMVLYKRCYTIADGNSSERIADNNTGNADGQISYCLQEDTSFGVNHYRLNYYQSEDMLYAIFTNLDTLGLGPFKAIYPDNMKIHALVIDCGDYFVLYLGTDTDSVKFPGIKKQIEDSMTSRMEAVYKWFIKQF